MEFKNTLVFSESVALRGQNNNLTYKEVSTTVQIFKQQLIHYISLMKNR